MEVLLQDVALLHVLFEQRPLCLFSASRLNFSLPKGGWTICVLCPRWCVSKCFWFLLPCEACSKFLSGVHFLENLNVSEPIGFALMLTQQSMLIVRVGAKPICRFLKKNVAKGRSTAYWLGVCRMQHGDFPLPRWDCQRMSKSIQSCCLVVTSCNLILGKKCKQHTVKYCKVL